jgi:hypothetical protein
VSEKGAAAAAGRRKRAQAQEEGAGAVLQPSIRGRVTPQPAPLLDEAAVAILQMGADDSAEINQWAGGHPLDSQRLE